jgi:hypothetical protein
LYVVHSKYGELFVKLPINQDRQKYLADQEQKAISELAAKQIIEWPLRDLASNVMRVSRGAGKPYEIFDNCCQVVVSFREYFDLQGTAPPSWDISEILRFRNLQLRRYGSLPDDLVDFFERAASGALRMSAGRLAADKLQASHGENELFESILEIERFRSNRR